MEFSNKKRTKKIKQRFILFLLVLALAAIYSVWKEMDLVAALTGGGAALLLFVVPLVNFYYIEYSSESNDIIIRYYPIITFLTGREYKSIEFPKSMLYAVDLKKNFLFKDLIISVKTKKGIADYPEISLSALSKKQIQEMVDDLRSQLNN